MKENSVDNFMILHLFHYPVVAKTGNGGLKEWWIEGMTELQNDGKS